MLLKLLSFVLLHDELLPKLRQTELQLLHEGLVRRFGFSLRRIFLIQLALEVAHLLVQPLHRILQLVVFGLDLLNSRFGSVGNGLFDLQVLKVLGNLGLESFDLSLLVQTLSFFLRESLRLILTDLRGIPQIRFEFLLVLRGRLLEVGDGFVGLLGGTLHETDGLLLVSGLLIGEIQFVFNVLALGSQVHHLRVQIFDVRIFLTLLFL